MMLTKDDFLIFLVAQCRNIAIPSVPTIHPDYRAKYQAMVDDEFNRWVDGEEKAKQQRNEISKKFGLPEEH